MPPMAILTLLPVVLSTLKGPQARSTQILFLSRVPLFGSFFRHRLETPLPQILVPTWVRLAMQLVAKIQQKSVQEVFTLQANLHHVFDVFFE